MSPSLLAPAVRAAAFTALAELWPAWAKLAAAHAPRHGPRRSPRGSPRGSPRQGRRVIEQLLQAKAESDRRNYAAKNAILRRLLQEDPGAFHIDSEAGDIVGLTHRSGFKIHTPRRTLPAGIRRITHAPTPRPR